MPATPARRPCGGLHDEAADAVVLPDRDGVAVRGDSDLWMRGAILVGRRQLDRRLPAPADRTYRALHGDDIPTLEALPDRNRVALRINGDLRAACAVAGGGKVHGRPPAPILGTRRALHDVLVAVVTSPDRDRVALRINGDPRVLIERARRGDVDRGLPRPAGHADRGLHDDVEADLAVPHRDRVTLCVEQPPAGTTDHRSRPRRRSGWTTTTPRRPARAQAGQAPNPRARHR